MDSERWWCVYFLGRGIANTVPVRGSPRSRIVGPVRGMSLGGCSSGLKPHALYSSTKERWAVQESDGERHCSNLATLAGK